MRVLVTYGSKRGGTEGIARRIAETLRDEGLDVELHPPEDIDEVSAYDAVIVGGALYANRWFRSARHFVHRHAQKLRERPVWFFSSGPLDDTAEQHEIAPTAQVQVLLSQVGARGHMTFGGRLEKDAKGFIAHAMARTHAGDWRDSGHIQRWARSVAAELRPEREGFPAPVESAPEAPSP
ncbi:flavodoxin domain-containing protein [Corallococcus carmarthensis]|uniref:Flavodoxin n=1 Tax=Corallococcus carmarthensis TaxID=2316728 RepID=A0A3A8KR71_9BACT|nr:flavodoxin domain-containing protein [Corallococcus carmarthensis]NOK16811.1 flavodoxin [Corallococcus carmarthensis]RKH06675.1 flavodoxin [Corallococcus carmarthensis]